MKIKPQISHILLLAFVSGLAYLPLAAQLGYSFDDWYLMWVAKAYGAQAFHDVFSIDRPLRAFLMIPVYQLFGENPLWYSLSAYAFRLLGALALGWMFRMLWPKAGPATTVMALLFVIYPGFLSQTNAIDYQSHIVALALATFSLALTVKAFQTPGLLWKRVALLAVSAVCGWLYLGLMEYYIGFELIRFLLIFLLAARARADWRGRLKKTLLDWLPLALIPVLFVYWRLFIFVGERKATDAGAQLGLLLAAPGPTVFHWTVGLFRDVLVVLVTAWVTPLSQLIGSLSGGQMLVGLGLGGLSVLAVVFALKGFDDADGDWRFEACWLGLASVVVGLAPVILANREIIFPYFSRYTLISSTGAVMLLAALIFWLPWKSARALAVSALVLAAMLTHFGNSVAAARETASNNTFWWQVAWRIPQLEANTTLVAHYPVVGIQEDYFVWGPANLIYFPEKRAGKDIQPGVYAALPNDATVQKVLARERQEYDKRRTIITYTNYRNILILTQPTPDSCVQVIDGQQPELSPNETQDFVAMAPYSEIDHVLPDAPPQTPPQIIFGAEPAHAWCYSYQKAALARQRGDWAEAVRLGDEAARLGLAPSDPVEWMPFLQAYAALGRADRLAAIGAQLAAQPSARAQACTILGEMNDLGAHIRQQVRELFCAGLP